jgi:hypothetical protein
MAKYEFLTKLRPVLLQNDIKAMKSKANKVARKSGYGYDLMLPQLSYGIHFGTDDLLYLSIQASAFHYCEPKQTLRYGKYKSFEVAAMFNGESVDLDKVLGAENEITIKMSKYKEVDADGSWVIYTYVPKELVEEFYQEMKRVFGLLEV